MTFTMEVKEEIAMHTFNQDQAKAFIKGYILSTKDLNATLLTQVIDLTTSSIKIVRTLKTLLSQFYDKEIIVKVIQNQNLNKIKFYKLELVEEVSLFLQKLKIDLLNIDNSFSDYWSYPKSNKRALLAGLFVSLGSVNSPSTSNYHCELQFLNEALCTFFIKALKEFKINFKSIKKRNKFVAYIKQVSLISDFLKLLDATSSVLHFENTRINRDIKNSVNRIINIEQSNQLKVLNTSQKQIHWIETIINKGLVNELSDKAQLLMKLRLDNPEYSYQQLQELMSDQNIEITKSGVSNLFKIIKKVYQTFKES